MAVFVQMAVLGYVVLAGFFSVVGRMVVMPLCDVRMMAGCFVVSRLMVCSCGAMVLGRVFKMLRCFAMVFCGFFGHGSPPSEMVRCLLGY
jgi:hypothetical protein